jgi:hypothetical protein
MGVRFLRHSPIDTTIAPIYQVRNFLFLMCHCHISHITGGVMMKRLPYPHRGVSRLVACCVLLALVLAVGHSVSAQATRIIFLHHSCGQNLINEGGVREGLTALGYEFYDHGYNEEGLRLADGSYTGTNFDVPGDNTDPDGFAAIFAQPLHDPPDNTFSHLMQYDVIAFKSCFPTSNIADDYQLNEYMSYYLAIRDRVDQHPEKVFIVVTQPPQVPGASDSAEATRARAFTQWLQSDEYLAGHPNVFVFDFFGLLAGSDNFLRPEYRYDDYDGHPNEQANREIGPQFVAFIDEAIRSYEGGGPRPAPIEAPAPAEEATEPPPVIAPPPQAGAPAAGVIDDFEAGIDEWYTDLGEGSAVECDTDTGTVHGGAASLRINYNIPPGGWGGCGHAFELPQDWSGGSGLSMWLRSEEAGRWVTLVLFAGNPDELTPFEVSFEVPTDWTYVVFAWTDFAKAEWMGDAGLAQLDPAQVTSFGFSINGNEAGVEGTLWADDISLATEEPPPPVAPPAEAPAAPAEEAGEEEAPRRRLCSGAAVVLPLGAMGILLKRRRRR